MPDRPVVYLFHGDDEPAIRGEIEKLRARVGDPGALEMNFTRLDGRSLAFDDLVIASTAMPFLAKRRLVVLEYPSAYAQDDASRKKLLELLERTPPSTALVLVEHQTLYSLLTREEKKKKIKHWLERWVEAAGDRVFEKKFEMQKGKGGAAGWIQKRARELGGEFSDQAAVRLAELSSNEASVLDQEIQKLLTYAGEGCIVEAQDVDRLAVVIPEKDIFKLVDALGNRNAHAAAEMFHNLLDEQDAQSIFPMIVRQFRLLLQARELLEAGVNEDGVTKILAVHPFVSQKILAQARRFPVEALEEAYHRLYQIDVATKTGDMDPDLSLNCWIAEYSA